MELLVCLPTDFDGKEGYFRQICLIENNIVFLHFSSRSVVADEDYFQA